MPDLLPALLAEHQPTSTLERHLTEQLAHILAKQATAEDNETYLLAKQPQYLLTHRPDGHLVPDPAYLLYNNRLDAMRLHQARLGREQSRVLRELHRLKRTPLAEKAASEPNSVANQNRASEPASAAFSANEPKPAAMRVVNEPKPAPTRPTNEPKIGVSPASEPGIPPSKRANEPKPGSYPVLSDAEADRIEAMIASGDVGQLEKAARLLGLMDGNAPAPPSLVALFQSKLAG